MREHADREGGSRMQRGQEKLGGTVESLRRQFESSESTWRKSEDGENAGTHTQRDRTGSSKSRDEEQVLARKESRPRFKAFLGDGLDI